VKIFVYHTPELTPSHDVGVADCAIAIDVLRATTTIAAALQAGADSVQVFSDLERLIQVSADWPEDRRIRIGERGGRTMQDCDMGNSPLDCTRDRVAGSRLFMSTTNGTRALECIATTPRVLTAALVNRQAVVNALLSDPPETLWLVGSGWEGSFSLEDTVCAGAVLATLVPKLAEPWWGNDEAIAALALYEQWRDRLSELLERASHGQRLLGLKNTADLEYCARQDLLDVVPTQIEFGVLVAGV
jgi:2-phosphosulfolactate phosphatase